MRSVVIGIAIIAFGALLIGGLWVTSGSPFEGAVQVRNPAASTVEATNSQLALLALVVLLVVGGVVVNGALLAGLFWLLNREALRAQASPPTPFEFSLSPEGNTLGSWARQNAVPLIVILSVFLVVAFFGLAVITGAFS
ncbi:MAG: hypothetical protein CUN55_08080 [Phototrophicales bacterium]|nr:MAG: hypothetical protein CUN55_08080 [Phototrophicales bacterium]